MVSGPLWATKAWGVYWTWDPRLTSLLLSILIYVALVVLRRFAGNGDVVCNTPDFEYISASHVLRGAQWDPCTLIRFEAGQRDLQRVGGHGNEIEYKFSRLPGQLIRDSGSSLVDKLDFRSWQNCSCTIRHYSSKSGGSELREPLGLQHEQD